MNNLLNIFKIKNILIKARNDKRFNILYYYLIYIFLRYSFIFLFNK